jgi:DNA-binding NarL/FixJ family response regulator
MTSEPAKPAAVARELRLMLVDDHEVSRAACRALLRTEGVCVVADLRLDDAVIETAERLRPDAAIIDVTPADDRPLALARRLEALPHAPVVLLISSADPRKFDPALAGMTFIPKAGICAAEVLGALRGRLVPQDQHRTRRNHELANPTHP